MKKIGFTLAEVLITLGIIGVIMALVAPSLIQNAGSSRVGPALRRAKTDFEESTSLLLAKSNVDSISELNDFLSSLQTSLKGIDKHTYEIAGIDTPNLRYDSETGVTYLMNIDEPCQSIIGGYPNIPNNQLIGEVYVDINGQRTPNELSRDVFMFFLYNDGTIRPNGIRDAYRCNKEGVEPKTWQGGNCDENGKEAPETCAGSVFENKLKVIYD